MFCSGGISSPGCAGASRSPQTSQLMAPGGLDVSQIGQMMGSDMRCSFVGVKMEGLSKSASQMSEEASTSCTFEARFWVALWSV